MWPLPNLKTKFLVTFFIEIIGMLLLRKWVLPQLQGKGWNTFTTNHVVGVALGTVIPIAGVGPFVGSLNATPNECLAPFPMKEVRES